MGLEILRGDDWLDNLEHNLEVISRSQIRLNSLIDMMVNKDFLTQTEEANLGQQVKDMEKTVSDIDLIATEISEAYGLIFNTFNHEIGNYCREQVIELRQRHLEEETDTSREARDALIEYMENPSKIGLLKSVLKFIERQVLPTIDEIEIIPFETAFIEDDTLDEGLEVEEVFGVDGEYTVTFEVSEEDGEEVKTEIERVITKEPVRRIVRVGTKVV